MGVCPGGETRRHGEAGIGALEIALGRRPFALAVDRIADGHVVGRHAFRHGAGGATDASFAQRSGKPAVLESLGLPGAGYHARDEYIEIEAIVPRLYLTGRMLMQLAKE